MIIKTSAIWRKGAFYPRYTLHVAGKCIGYRVVEYACPTKQEAIDKAEQVVKTARLNIKA